ncbi:MAG: toxin-antitoxin system YwqK family antitoxin [Saprospiraceae bacterium]|nr:toxin-antitoxin system YwqK family antitoxin [Saprospiraceae bacterium]MBP7679788.1 toxin-antitoxin system YwqK family antitoxin [Saprospiraceae bacterium]
MFRNNVCNSTPTAVIQMNIELNHNHPKTTPLFVLLGAMPLLVFSSCCKTETITQRHEDGMITVLQRDKKTQKKEGTFIKKYPDGKVFETAIYHHDTLVGERKLYHPNGNLQAVEHYRNGQFDGDYKGYYENGTLELEGKYSNGSMNGEWLRYYDTKELMEKVLFKDNEENGPFTEYYRNGNLKAEGNYLNGDNEQGELKLYNEQGALVKKMDCNMGACKTIWQNEIAK